MISEYVPLNFSDNGVRSPHNTCVHSCRSDELYKYIKYYLSLKSYQDFVSNLIDY